MQTFTASITMCVRPRWNTPSCTFASALCTTNIAMRQRQPSVGSKTAASGVCPSWIAIGRRRRVLCSATKSAIGAQRYFVSPSVVPASTPSSIA
jgi:hypothetical protein